MRKHNYTLTYAQNREDIIIDAYFDGKPSGFYVDVGASHPTEESVTKLLYDKGWHGINFEPNDNLAMLLRADRPNDNVVGKGLADTLKTGTFRDYGNESTYSTFSKTYANSEDKGAYTDLPFELSTLAIELAKYSDKDTKIDFMKVDVNGLEYEVIEGNDWEKHRPELVCIDSNNHSKDWRPLLDAAGYDKFFNDGLNDYYAIRGSIRAKNFSFREKVINKHPHITRYVSHAEALLVENSSYLEDVKPAKKKISTNLQIRWSLIGLRDALNHGLVRAIVRRKRNILKNRISASLQSGGLDIRISKTRYYDARLFGLLVIGVTFRVITIISNKVPGLRL